MQSDWWVHTPEYYVEWYTQRLARWKIIRKCSVYNRLNIFKIDALTVYRLCPWMLNQPIILRQAFQQKNPCWDECTFGGVWMDTQFTQVILISYQNICPNIMCGPQFMTKHDKPYFPVHWKLIYLKETHL